MSKYAGDKFSETQNMFAALKSGAESAGVSAEKAEKKIGRLARGFDYLAARLPEISAAVDSLGKYYKNAQDLDINFSDTTDTFLKEMNAVSAKLDAIKKGKTEDKNNEKAAAAKIAACVCKSAASPAAAAAAAGGDGAEAGALAKAAAEGEQEYAGQGKKQGDIDRDSSKKNKDQKIAAEKEMWAKRVSAAGRGAGMMSNIMQNLYQATGRKSKAMFAAMKAFAIAETVIQTYRAAQGAYAAMAKVHPALGVAAAAVAIAAGMARVKAIAATKPKGATGTINAGGRANPSYGGGSFGAYPAPQRNEEEPKAPQQITVNIYNPLSEQNWAEIAENNIAPALNELAGRNVVVRVMTVS